MTVYLAHIYKLLVHTGNQVDILVACNLNKTKTYYQNCEHKYRNEGFVCFYKDS